MIFGHADADGHLAAEQSRRNLEALGVSVDRVIVGSETWNYRFWGNTFAGFDFGDFRLAAVVDIAFRFRDPRESLKAVIETVDAYPETRFVLVDHHPMVNPLIGHPNLELIEVESPYECCIGPSSPDLMGIAAICDGGGILPDQLTQEATKRAIGVRRAAADTHGIAGVGLMSLLRDNRWDFFEALAEEAKSSHITARGRRTRSAIKSPLLESVRTSLFLESSK